MKFKDDDVDAVVEDVEDVGVVEKSDELLFVAIGVLESELECMNEEADMNICWITIWILVRVLSMIFFLCYIFFNGCIICPQKDVK